ncbi:PspA/IM30 family protein [Pseudocolwellia sp. HL-MZ7]|uniref:PspA/IM30 family protein n=1 Tax=Pseudocolwellia sp. HL-MZ7 TaxID=3400627 RepID=UPI003CF5EE7C
MFESTAAKYIAEKKTLQRQIDNTEKTIASWNTKAQISVQKGRDDLAKLALKEKYKFTEELTQLTQEMARLDEYLLAVQEDASRLQDKLIEAKRKQASFVLRQQSAEVRLKVRAQATVHNIDEAISRFERYEQKIDRVEAQVEAYDLAQPKNLESEFRALEAEAHLEDELAQFKKQVANA